MNPVWFDRDEVLNVLNRRVVGFLSGYRQNLALLGPEGVGKTTLLRRLLEEGGVGSSAVVITLSVPEEESVPEWAVRFVQAVLYGVLQVKGYSPLPADLPTLCEAACRWVPKVAAQAGLLLNRAGGSGGAGGITDSLWDLPFLVTQELGIPCLLVLDEFDRLKNLPVADPFGRLGRKIMVQSTTMYLLTSSRPGLARSILREGLNLLFGQFEVVDLDPLSRAVCRKAIRALLNSDRVDPFLEHLVMELAQGYPGYLDLLLRGWRDLEDLLERQLFDPEGSLRVRFEAKVRQLPAHPDRLVWVQVLEAMSHGIHRMEPMAAQIGRPVSQVRRALQVLEQGGWVTRQGIFHSIPDRFLRLWMVTAYPLLQGVGLADGAQARARFREAVSGWVQKVERAVRLPIEQQAMTLLRRWAGECVQIEGRRVLLPRWDRVEFLPGPMLAAHRRRGQEGKSWLVVPWAGPFQELQALKLAKELFRPPFKSCRKVLLGAEPVEFNARLILKEAQIMLWNLQTFNLLLDLYGLTGIPLPETASVFLAEPIPLGTEGLPALQDSRVQKAS